MLGGRSQSFFTLKFAHLSLRSFVREALGCNSPRRDRVGFRCEAKSSSVTRPRRALTTHFELATQRVNPPIPHANESMNQRPSADIPGVSADSEHTKT